MTVDMKVILLAGGFGTRISEESHLRPKPMVDLGGMPILWHIMKIYSAFGRNDFVVCAGYMQYVIKEWFAHYALHTSDVTLDFRKGGELEVHRSVSEPWRVTIADTGIGTMTGGRLLRVKDFVGDRPFMLTYGDGVADIDIDRLWDFHRSHGKVATISVYNVGQNYGVIDVGADGLVREFREKSALDGAQVNIGFMVFNPEIFSYLEDDSTVLEREPLATLAHGGQLAAYPHTGYWKCMDTVRDKRELEERWQAGNAPWKVWN